MRFLLVKKIIQDYWNEWMFSFPNILYLSYGSYTDIYATRRAWGFFLPFPFPLWICEVPMSITSDSLALSSF